MGKNKRLRGAFFGYYYCNRAQAVVKDRCAAVWDRTPPRGVQWILHRESFYDALIQQSNLIYQEVQWVGDMWIVAGTNVCTVVETQSRFVREKHPKGQLGGIFRIGHLGDFYIYKNVNPSFGLNNWVIGCKRGNTISLSKPVLAALGTEENLGDSKASS